MDVVDNNTIVFDLRKSPVRLVSTAPDDLVIEAKEQTPHGPVAVRIRLNIGQLFTLKVQLGKDYNL